MGESPDRRSAPSESETAVFERSLSAVVRWQRTTRKHAFQQACPELSPPQHECCVCWPSTGL
jgi:hypothetical protein